MSQAQVAQATHPKITPAPLLRGLTDVFLTEDGKRQVLNVLNRRGDTIVFSPLTATLLSGVELLVRFDKPIGGLALSRVLHDQYDVDFNIPGDLFGLCFVSQGAEYVVKTLLIMREGCSWLFPLTEDEFTTLRASR